MTYGFIYCLTNQYMPGICKIGRTDRAPSQRCHELSGSTSAPWDFDIQFYVEVDDSLRVERAIHVAFDQQRINPCREFFSCAPADAYEWLRCNADITTEYLDGDVIHEIHKRDEAVIAKKLALVTV
ncbi:GIY-YIG nuclease family protein [Pseudomonas typographi]|uniref:GIY-YIG nuclease family protein n=1 Tax=Pseudomonas typographi TaxID=2715964 RepID=UPI0016854193|nr:GIY-YIG nuclease family protein [Pseudomonas typographi]MBD1554682.1 GIY-YIG nuclease family protein [Pseudomonas typographi]